MRVYTQFAIYWLAPPNTDMKQICLQICENGGVCRIAKIAKQYSNPQHQLGTKYLFDPNTINFKKVDLRIES